MKVMLAETDRILRKLLLASGPEKAARLKQRMIVEFALEGRGRFDERDFGYPKFKDFLQKAHGDLVVLKESEGGDMVVSLSHPSLTKPLTPRSVEPVIRSDVWQAFTNPDRDRKRFYVKKTSEVIHFRAAEEKQRLSAFNEADLTPIEPIDGSVQRQWMEDFLGTIRLSDDQRKTLTELLKQPYSAALNLTFTRALAENAPPWKRARQTHITNVIRHWAEQHAISIDSLYRADQPRSERPLVTASAVKASSVRRDVMAILEILSDEDLERAVLPFLTAAIFLRPR